MKLKDILPEEPLDRIMVRTNDPWDEDPDGMLFGYVGWDGANLVDLDGDYYSLNEEVTRYEWEEDGSLTYWIHSDWSVDSSGHVAMREEPHKWCYDRLCERCVWKDKGGCSEWPIIT